MTARPVLAQAGFAGHALDIALGVSFAESEGYSDAIGDTTLVNDKWGPSIGLFQVRSLKYPHIWGPADSYREVFALRNPYYNAVAAYAISKGGTDWQPWSVYRSEAYLRYVGDDYQILTGHVRADQWRLGIVTPTT